MASSAAGVSLELRYHLPDLSGRVGSGWVGLGRVGSGWVGLGRVGSDWVGLGRIGELRGGCGEAGGAGGLPAGWQPAFQDGQDSHPP